MAREQQFHSNDVSGSYSINQWLSDLTREMDEESGENIHDIKQFQIYPTRGENHFGATVLCDHLVDDDE